jgi:hypothetical protein
MRDASVTSARRTGVAKLRALCSAALRGDQYRIFVNERNRGAALDDSQAHATQRGVDLVDNQALLAASG